MNEVPETEERNACRVSYLSGSLQSLELCWAYRLCHVCSECRLQSANDDAKRSKGHWHPSSLMQRRKLWGPAHNLDQVRVCFCCVQMNPLELSVDRCTWSCWVGNKVSYVLNLSGLPISELARTMTVQAHLVSDWLASVGQRGNTEPACLWSGDSKSPNLNCTACKMGMDGNQITMTIIRKGPGPLTPGVSRFFLFSFSFSFTISFCAH